MNLFGMRTARRQEMQLSSRTPNNPKDKQNLHFLERTIHAASGHEENDFYV
jgi:hypothetical protein